MAAQHTPHLYIVEDDEAWIELLSTKLEGRYTISKFTTGEAAVQALISLPPEVIILDYHLAGTMTGKDVLKKIHKECPNKMTFKLRLIF
jgi:CheY-like chemotaxis protein